MRYGVTVPNIGELELLLTMGREAEAAGWDGFFLWDHIRFSDAFDVSVHDPWVAHGRPRGHHGAAPPGTDGHAARAAPTVDGRARDRDTRPPEPGPPDLRRRAGVPARRRVRVLRGAHGRSGTRRATRRGARDPRRALVGRARHGGRAALPARRCQVPAPADAAPPDPGLDRGDVAEPGAVPSRRPLGRRVPDRGGRRQNRSRSRPTLFAEAVAFTRSLRASEAPFDAVVQGAPDTEPGDYATAGATWWLLDRRRRSGVGGAAARRDPQRSAALTLGVAHTCRR